MSDSYQAVYDAVRSRLSNCDIGSAVKTVMREANIAHYAEMANRAIDQALSYYEDPCVIYRPRRLSQP